MQVSVHHSRRAIESPLSIRTIRNKGSGRAGTRSGGRSAPFSITYWLGCAALNKSPNLPSLASPSVKCVSLCVWCEFSTEGLVPHSVLGMLVAVPNKFCCYYLPEHHNLKTNPPAPSIALCLGYAPIRKSNVETQEFRGRPTTRPSWMPGAVYGKTGVDDRFSFSYHSLWVPTESLPTLVLHKG